MSTNPILPGDESQQPVLSRLEEIKARREQLLADLTHDIDVPSWEGNVVARYRVVGEADREDLRKARKDSDTEALAAVLIKACVGVYMKDEDGELQPLAKGDGGPVARYDGTLRDILGLEGTTNIEVLQYAFGGDNPTAIDVHAGELGEWMANPTRRPGQTPKPT